jgi:hypothetical protein
VGQSGGIRGGKRGRCAPFVRGGWLWRTVFLSVESREIYCDMGAQIEARDLLIVTY